MHILTITETIWTAIRAEAERRYPAEACGFLLGDLDSFGVREFVPCRNIQDELHASDPKRFPRTAATAYVIAPEDEKRTQDLATQQGLKIIAIVHSHPDHDAYFSDEDRLNAAPWGEPLFPNVNYVVVSVFGGVTKAVSEFFWDETDSSFKEKKIY